MTIETYEKIKKEIKQEILNEFVFSMLKDLKDSEGEYKKEFVKKILKAAKDKPIYTYNPKTFLYQIGGK